MEIGSIIGNFDVAQVTLYAFWIFFAGLIIYLRREDKREGYPLETDLPDRVVAEGFPSVPKPKVFKLSDGTKRLAPRPEPPAPEIKAKPVEPWLGAPLVPTGNPMLDAVGPASYAMREDVVDRILDGEPKVSPLRVASEFYVAVQDKDPRGVNVIAADKRVAGTVFDLWIDRSEPQIRYIEVELVEDGKRVLLPIGFARIISNPWQHHVKVVAILAEQFADVPGTKNPDEVTRLEEDRISAYFASGHLYAKPARQEPFL